MHYPISQDRDDNRQVIGGGLPIRSKKVVTFDGTSGNGAALATATLTTNLTGLNNDITFTAAFAGSGGNDITVEYIDPGAINQSLAVSLVAGTKRIQVSLATDGTGVITSTSADIESAISSLAAVTALVAAADAGGNDGSGVVTAMAETALSAGDGNIPLFTVTGAIACRLTARCLVDVTDDGSGTNLSAGVPMDTSAIIGAIQATNMRFGSISTPSAYASTGAGPIGDEFYINDDIVAAAGSAGNITGGQIEYILYWRPSSDDADVVVA